jgi:hypothetical protein
MSKDKNKDKPKNEETNVSKQGIVDGDRPKTPKERD